MLIIQCEQQSPAWFSEKLGKPSASNASIIMAKGKGGSPSATRTVYMHELADQLVSGYREEHYKSKFMEMGNEREPESRACFEFEMDVDVTQVGVVYRDEKRQYLCSPDGIVNNEYGVELKNVKGSTQVDYLLKGVVPSVYKPQIQMSLLITGFKFWYFMSYKPGLRPLIVKVERDEAFISALESELGKFCDELRSVVERIK